MFITAVCSAVEREMSPMRARAPVLKTPIATPESAISTLKDTNVVVAMKRYDVAANRSRPATIVDFHREQESVEHFGNAASNRDSVDPRALFACHFA